MEYKILKCTGLITDPNRHPIPKALGRCPSNKPLNNIYNLLRASYHDPPQNTHSIQPTVNPQEHQQQSLPKMATVTLPPTFADSTLNLSSLRPPLTSAHPERLSDQLPPQIDFGFDDLRNTMSTFTKRFNDYIERGRRQLLNERNAHRMHLSSLAEQTSHAEEQTRRLRERMSAHEEGVRGQSLETEVMHAEIRELSATRDRRKEEVQGLQVRMRDVQRAVAGAKKAGKEKREWLEGQRERDVAELRFWEEVLGVRIEGTGSEDVARFVFMFERKRREASFELGMGDGYEIRECRPGMESRREEMNELARGMETNEDLGTLLKGMRTLFLEVI